jgi:hypothetical protein
VLEKMNSKGAEAVDYMPAWLKDLPGHLKKRAMEILLEDPFAGFSGSSGRPFEITPETLGKYRLLHKSPEVVHEVEQIADFLGWRKR